jgi:NAD(P)-dependent dehydrogenase (short-subunit alcohol dehydrogenase family)
MAPTVRTVHADGPGWPVAPGLCPTAGATIPLRMKAELVLTGTVALVTGASRGIGRAVAMALAGAGCDVALLARDTRRLGETAEMCAVCARRTLVLPGDVSDRSVLETAVERTVAELGGLHVLVNNAGVFAQGSAAELDLDVARRAFAINIDAPLALTRLALPHMLAAQGRRRAIVNIASISGKMSFRGAGIYAASKHALVGYSGSLYEDVREAGIKVCAICPGYVNTRMANLDPGLNPELMIQPDDVARAVLFVVRYPDTGCPTEIIIRPQRSPYR